MTEAVDVVKAVYAAFTQGDGAAVLALVGEDVDWESYGAPGLLLSGPKRGRAAVGAFFQAIGETTTIHEFTPQHFVAQGDMVVVLGSERITANATGREVTAQWAHAFRVRDGKIVWYRGYSDTDAMRWVYGHDHRT